MSDSLVLNSFDSYWNVNVNDAMLFYQDGVTTAGDVCPFYATHSDMKSRLCASRAVRRTLGSNRPGRPKEEQCRRRVSVRNDHLLRGSVAREVDQFVPYQEPTRWQGPPTPWVISVSSLYLGTCVTRRRLVLIQEAFGDDVTGAPMKVDGPALPGAQELYSTSLKGRQGVV